MAKKILIVAPNWLGDLVMAQSLFILLKTQLPNCQIDVLAPKWCLDVVKRMPEISHAIINPCEHGQLQWSLRRAIAKQLKQTGYDFAYVLPNSLKSALIPWFAGIPTRIGFIGEWRFGLLNDYRTLDKVTLPKMHQRYASLAISKSDVQAKQSFDAPYPKLHSRAGDIDLLLEKYRLLKVNDKLIAFAPGAAYGDTKRWPTGHYAALALKIIEQGGTIWLFGAPNEVEQLEGLREKIGAHCFVITEASLSEKIDLLTLSSAMVCNDSGLMHVASALGLPTFAIFGSTSELHTPPLGEHSHAIALKSVACRPCFKKTCRWSDNQKLQCLTQITPEQVYQAMVLEAVI